MMSCQDPNCMRKSGVAEKYVRVVQEMYGRQSGEEMDGVKLHTDRLGQAGVPVDNDVCR